MPRREDLQNLRAGQSTKLRVPASVYQGGQHHVRGGMLLPRRPPPRRRQVHTEAGVPVSSEEQELQAGSSYSERVQHLVRDIQILGLL